MNSLFLINLIFVAAQTKMKILSKKRLIQLNYVIITGFFLIAGINHFRDPDFYFPLIPNYIPFPNLINGISGGLEIILALGFLLPKYREISIWGIIILLILFIPSHVHFIQIGSCVEGSLCVPEWIAWVRLVIIHPLLLFWVWKSR